MLLACRLLWWPGENIDGRLNSAYASFAAWCRGHRATTSLVEFDLKKTFKCTSLLASKISLESHSVLLCVAKLHSYAIPVLFNLSLKDCPRLRGKAYDTTVVCKWLHDVLHFGPVNGQHASWHQLCQFSHVSCRTKGWR